MSKAQFFRNGDDQMLKTKVCLVLLIVTLLSAVCFAISRSSRVPQSDVSKSSRAPRLDMRSVLSWAQQVWSQQGKEDAERVKNKLAASVARVGRKQDSSEQVSSNQFVNLKESTDFEWDRVYIFPPYTSLERVNEDLGFVWPHARSIGIEYRDDMNLLVFVADKQVVRYVEFLRYYGDFSHSSSDIVKLEKHGGFSPDEAVFTVVPKGYSSDDGHPWVWLMPRKQE